MRSGTSTCMFIQMLEKWYNWLIAVSIFFETTLHPPLSPHAHAKCCQLLPPSTSPSPTFHVCVFMTDHFVITSSPLSYNPIPITQHSGTVVVEVETTIAPPPPPPTPPTPTPQPQPSTAAVLLTTCLSSCRIHLSLQIIIFTALILSPTPPFPLRWGGNLACNTTLSVHFEANFASWRIYEPHKRPNYHPNPPSSLPFSPCHRTRKTWELSCNLYCVIWFSLKNLNCIYLTSQ